MFFDVTAHISPPGMRLEAEDKAIVVYISPPGQNGNMWAQERSDFNYTILIWQKSSGDKVSFCFYLIDVREKVNEF